MKIMLFVHNIHNKPIYITLCLNSLENIFSAPLFQYNSPQNLPKYMMS